MPGQLGKEGGHWGTMDVFVARQPIFTKNKEIYGYELLFRDGISNAFPGIDGDTATSKILSSSFFAFGIDTLIGKKKAFINFTQELLVRKVPTMFPRGKIIVEILEDVEPEQEVVDACQEISRRGYGIALDDFRYKIDLHPLVDLAGVIKIDFKATPNQEIKETLEKLSSFDLKFLAEKVESYETFQWAVEMGFDYFQGYFFCKPETLKTRDLAPSKISLLQIMAEATKEDFSFKELEELIVRDISLSFKLLSYINSAYFRRVQEISSIQQAIVLLGEKEIRRFISLIAMAKLASNKPEELIRESIIRARLCELLGEHRLGIDESKLFTLGLFSLIDAILDDTMANIMEKLPFSGEFKIALIQGEGDLADYVNLISCYETGNWDEAAELVQKMGVDEKKLPEYYRDAVGWADSYMTV
jgi:c-di-GMP-related signal transduction protein